MATATKARKTGTITRERSGPTFTGKQMAAFKAMDGRLRGLITREGDGTALAILGALKEHPGLTRGQLDATCEVASNRRSVGNAIRKMQRSRLIAAKGGKGPNATYEVTDAGLEFWGLVEPIVET